MKIYIASSWRNEHAVTLFTALLRTNGYEVISWVENNYGEHHNHVTKKLDFESWVNTEDSEQSFFFDTNGAMTCDIFIYLGTAGQDAAAECGMCYGQRLAGRTIPMYALWAKGEGFGLMRKMFDRIFGSAAALTNYILKRHPPAKQTSSCDGQVVEFSKI